MSIEHILEMQQKTSQTLREISANLKIIEERNAKMIESNQKLIDEIQQATTEQKKVNKLLDEALSILNT